jgi:hypothetical protein
MTIADQEVDWAMLVAPGEEWTEETVSNYCDTLNTDGIYGYPVMMDDPRLKNGIVNRIIESLNSALVEYKPLEIPGVFKL